MTHDRDDMTMLQDELHELADAVAVPTNSLAARDRARRGIARHQRNRRAGVSAAAGALVIAATVFVAVDHDGRTTRQPIGTTEPAAATTTSSLRGPASTTPLTGPVVTSVPSGPIDSTIPPVPSVPAATPSYSNPFAWGTGPGEVAFHTPAGEGASGGPAAFSADAAGDIVMLDHSNARLVKIDHGTASVDPISGLSPAVTAAVFDSKGRVIVATVADLAVYGPNGQPQGSWTGMANGTQGIYRLEVDGNAVYEVDFAIVGHTERTLLLRDNGSGYEAVRNARPEADPTAVSGSLSTQGGVLTVVAGGRQYRLTTGPNDVRAIKLLPDGSLVFVVGIVQSGVTDPSTPQPYIIGRIESNGTAHYSRVEASTGYLTNGAEFDITNAGVAVMGSTIADGVTVAYYPYS